MTPLKFYKFINDNSIEWHWNHYDFNWHLLVFIPAYLLVDFCSMFQYSDFDDGGLPGEQVVKYDGSVAFDDFQEICEILGFTEEEVDEIFPKDEQK